MEGKRKEIVENCLRLLDDDLSSWLESKLENIEDKQSFFINFGLIGRKIPHSTVQPEKSLVGDWTLDQYARLALLLGLPVEKNLDFIKTLLSASDMREQVVIFKSLPYLSNAQDFVWMAVDGIRTNMVDVFDAIALENEFPAKFFNEDAWNQMVLKAIFMERPLYRIQGLDTRKNQKLSQILYDFVHERWSAKRSVTPELWRLMEGFIDLKILEDLKRVVHEDTPLAREAALKTLVTSTFAPALDWLRDQDRTDSGRSWEDIGKQIQKET